MYINTLLGTSAYLIQEKWTIGKVAAGIGFLSVLGGVGYLAYKKFKSGESVSEVKSVLKNIKTPSADEVITKLKPEEHELLKNMSDVERNAAIQQFEQGIADTNSNNQLSLDDRKKVVKSMQVGIDLIKKYKK